MAAARPSQGVPAMKRFLICFRVEQTFNASIEVEAPSAEDARNSFYGGACEAPRFAAELDLVESEDTITRIRPLEDLTIASSIALSAWSAQTGVELQCRLAWATAARDYLGLR